MMRLLFFSLVILAAGNTHAQNLLANGSFEDRNVCTELHAICAPEGWFRIPLNAVSSSKGTAGFFLGDHHESMVMENVKAPGIGRSYIYTRTLCPLEKGREYIFTAQFRTGKNNFSHVNLLWTSFEPFRFQGKTAREKNRLTITKENEVSDLDDDWKEYRIHFIAAGNEQYLLIGNLTADVFHGKPQRRPFIIYEIDNVTLFPADRTVNACPERDKNKEILYQYNYRHTPGKFIDQPLAPPEEKKPVIQPPPVVINVPPPAPVVMPPVVNDTLVIPDVLFKFDKSELNPAFAYRLDTLISKIKNKTFKRIEVLGHTDSLGTDEYNKRLSLSRAETVKKYLIDRLHYPADIIVTKGFAATLPVTSNATARGRQQNRRVELVLVK